MATLLSYGKKLTAYIPTPMSGLALGLASLGWCISNLFPAFFVLKPLSALLAGFILLLLVLKFVHQPAQLRADLAHPVVGSVLPTSAMTIMVISHSVSTYSHLIATVVWLFAIALHLGLLASFVYFRSRNFELNQLVPSWFIPLLGLSLLTSPLTACQRCNLWPWALVRGSDILSATATVHDLPFV
ncbi:hypothetical protein [Pseudoalteromonas piscicida]|uniref:SLAC1 family transporter n=1 Tax=Pseudoalteromonas piscicida TaxID=43662 RepID=UPI001CB7FA2A|nr:hypothetical protein [Pseudoalteromonas piscicida]